MAMSANDIERLIKAQIPDAEITIRDLAGDGDHYAATVISESFRGKSRVQQHQIVYRVRAGETLSSIARRHGMPVSTLARLNNMETGDTLVKGQRLIIRASARRYRNEGVASARRVLYTVRRGDTVYSISRQFQVSVTQLKSWNGINERHQIKAGQRLVMYVDAARQQG